MQKMIARKDEMGIQDRWDLACKSSAKQIFEEMLTKVESDDYNQIDITVERQRINFNSLSNSTVQ